MTDADLIALAALVNASCTEIAAANQGRAINEQLPDYYRYSDLYGDEPAARIIAELARRQRIRDIEQGFEAAGEDCSQVETKFSRFCMLKIWHEGNHAVVFEQYGEKMIGEWPRSADEPKPVAAGEDIPF